MTSQSAVGWPGDQAAWFNQGTLTTVLGGALSVMGPGVSSSSSQNFFFSSVPTPIPSSSSVLKPYFNITHSFVRWKLFELIVPPALISRSSHDLFEDQGDKAEAPLRLHPRDQSLDLYIPLMSFITYVLLVGLRRGWMDVFHPDDLSNTASFALLLVGIEVVLVKAAIYFGATSSEHSLNLSFLDMIAIAGYKFVHLSLACLCLIGQSKGSWAWWIVWAVVGCLTASSVFAEIRRFADGNHRQPSAPQFYSSQTSSGFSKYVALGAAAGQFISAIFLL